jgi:hypothetical protein
VYERVADSEAEDIDGGTAQEIVDGKSRVSSRRGVMVFATSGSDVMQPRKNIPAKACPMPVKALMRSTWTVNWVPPT